MLEARAQNGRRTSAGVVSIMLVAAFLIAACAPAATQPAAPSVPPASSVRPTAIPPTQTPERPRNGGILTITAAADPASLDAQQEPSANVSQVAAPAYNNLLYYDTETGSKIVPELAAEWSISADGMTYSFKIRPGVKFHDGTQLTADDVAFNIERMRGPPKGVLSNVASYIDAIDKTEVVGGDIVRIHTQYPFAPLVAALVHDYMPMYSKARVEKDGSMKTTMMGTGPFKLKSFTPGVSVELIKNTDYWVKDRPYLDGVTFLIIKDPATRLAALRTGQAKQSGRVFAALSPTEVATLKKDIPSMRFIPSPSVVGPWFFMNLRKPPFNDVRVRNAVQLAIDRQAAIKVIAEGEGEAGNFFPFEGWGIPRSELLKMPGYRQPKDQDIAEAKKLLADAGYANGFDLTVLSRTNDITKKSAIFMTDQLAKIGVKAEVKVLEDALFFGTGRKGEQQAMVFTPGTVIGDPHTMGRLFAPRNPLNYSGNDDDPKLNDMWNRQVRIVDEKARKALIEELERYLLTEELPAAPIVWPTTFIAVSSLERGFNPGPTDYSNNRHQETWLAQ